MPEHLRTDRNPPTPAGFTNVMLINDSVTHEMDITRWLLGQEITSVTVMRPRRYELVVDDEVAEQAARLITSEA